MEEIKTDEELTENSLENVNDNLQNDDSRNIEQETAKIDYGALIKEDVRSLSEEFYELRTLTDITELENPIRYAALRDLGLTPAEAYLATTKRTKKSDNRAHLERAVPRRAGIPEGAMSDSELAEAREIFSDLSDAEIKRLYRKVNK